MHTFDAGFHAAPGIQLTNGEILSAISAEKQLPAEMSGDTGYGQ